MFSQGIKLLYIKQLMTIFNKNNNNNNNKKFKIPHMIQKPN